MIPYIAKYVPGDDGWRNLLGFSVYKGDNPERASEKEWHYQQPARLKDTIQQENPEPADREIIHMLSKPLPYGAKTHGIEIISSILLQQFDQYGILWQAPKHQGEFIWNSTRTHWFVTPYKGRISQFEDAYEQLLHAWENNHNPKTGQLSTPAQHGIMEDIMKRSSPATKNWSIKL